MLEIFHKQIIIELGVFSYNDVDVLLTFSFDLFPRSQKTDFCSNMPLTDSTACSAYLLEPL